MPLFKSIFSILMVSCLLLVFPAGQADAAKRYERTVVAYPVPDVTLINQEREKVSLKELLLSDQPVFVDFVYATCTTICPVLSAGISNMQKKLGAEGVEARFVSITIDPEHDSPEILKKYLARYRAKPGWDFLTGSRKDIDETMRAFDAYVPDKMEHFPVMFIRDPDKKNWVRIYGLIGTRDLMAEYKGLYSP